MNYSGRLHQLRFHKEKIAWYHELLLPLYLFVSIFYLTIIFKFATQWDIWFAYLVIIAEIYRVAFATLSLYCARTMQFPHFKKSIRQAKVDVIIPTLNEPRSILEMTVKGALAMRGVNKVLLLDDGDRQDIKQMAHELGCFYGARRSSLHAKAGNMNFGLKHSDAEFIITLDADHIPQPNFIERTLGYFADPKLAFVQTPQSFYNTTSIQHRNVKGYSLWNEQTMFYESIQPAKNAFNAAFFCGSSAILRRSAIDSVGGFATGTATEDIHTSVRLHSKGWNSLFINERLAFGLAPEDLKEYHKQRVRWGAGSLGLLLRTKDSPLIIKNLTFMQRMGYLNSTLAYALGFVKLFYYFLPLYILLFYQTSLTFSFYLYALFNIPYLIAGFWITKVYSRNTYHPLYTEQYNVINIFSNIQALKGVWKIQKKFSVAIKLKYKKENSFVFFALVAILFIMVTAQLYGIGYWLTALEGNIRSLLGNNIAIAMMWNGINIFYVGSVVNFLYQYNKGLQEEKKTRVDISSMITEQLALLKVQASTSRMPQHRFTQTLASDAAALS